MVKGLKPALNLKLFSGQQTKIILLFSFGILDLTWTKIYAVEIFVSSDFICLALYNTQYYVNNCNISQTSWLDPKQLIFCMSKFNCLYETTHK